MAGTETESRKALRELIDLLGEVDERWLSPEWRIESPDDVVDGHRALMHILQGGLFGHFEDEWLWEAGLALLEESECNNRLQMTTFRENCTPFATAEKAAARGATRSRSRPRRP